MTRTQLKVAYSDCFAKVAAAFAKANIGVAVHRRPAALTPRRKAATTIAISSRASMLSPDQKYLLAKARME